MDNQRELAKILHRVCDLLTRVVPSNYAEEVREMASTAHKLSLPQLVARAEGEQPKASAQGKGGGK